MHEVVVGIWPHWRGRILTLLYAKYFLHTLRLINNTGVNKEENYF